MNEFLKFIKDPLKFFKTFIKDTLTEAGWEGLGDFIAWLIDSGLLLLILWGGWKLGNSIYDWIRARRLKKVLRPYYTYSDVKEATRYYVRTKGQSDQPGNEQEGKIVPRQDLLNLFIKDVFAQRGDKQKYYIVLGGAGMGKTTFMINLLVRYRLKLGGEKQPIVLIPLYKPDVLKRIAAIEEKENTILLLDALDEDPKANENPQAREDELVNATGDFRTVIITCRTQFFASQSAEPKETSLKGKDRYEQFKHIYVSPFSSGDVDKYLRKRFGFFKPRKKKKAKLIEQRIQKEMMRPMLLSNIEELIEAEKDFITLHEIYEVLVEIWLEREAKKTKNSEEDQKKFKENLHNFSRAFARRVYDQPQNQLSKSESEQFASTFELPLSEMEMRSRSLLNRNDQGEYKFAHRSFLEYFLALEMEKDSEFYKEFMQKNASMDLAKTFIKEMLLYPEMLFVPIGLVARATSFYRRKRSRTSSGFYLAKTPVTVRQYRNYCEKSGAQFPSDSPPWGWQDDHPMVMVSWNNAQRFCEWLSSEIGLNWRLPKEAEWEYAAKGGSQSRGYKYAGSNDIEEVAWYSGNSEGKTHPVGMLKPNELGFFDMSGNVWDWCEDLFEKGLSLRVVRGGGWSYYPGLCRPSYRYGISPEGRSNGVGFRLAFSL